jgi:hypothetical protein
MSCECSVSAGFVTATTPNAIMAAPVATPASRINWNRRFFRFFRER